MTEFSESNPNLRPDGKRRWKPRKGLTNPAERMEELRKREELNSNEVLNTERPDIKPRVIVQRDMPLDAADRAEEEK
jgi:hypothetical protein